MEAGSPNNSCSNFTTTNSFLIRIHASLGAVSFATCLAALCWLLHLKLYKQFLYRLAAYQVMASLFHALLLVCQFAFLEYSDSKYPSCVTVAFFYQIALWMKASFGGCITFHLFCFAVLLKNMSRLEPLYVVTSILFSVVVSSVPLITKSYGPTGEWCWIEGKQCGDVYKTGFIEQIAVWFGPAFLMLVLQSIAMLTMIITVYYRAHQKSDRITFGRERNKKAFKQLLPLVAYPILFCVLIVPAMVNRVYGFASITHSFFLLIVVTVCAPFYNLSAGLTLIVHIGVLKRAEVMTCLRAPWRRQYMNYDPNDATHQSAEMLSIRDSKAADAIS